MLFKLAILLSNQIKILTQIKYFQVILSVSVADKLNYLSVQDVIGVVPGGINLLTLVFMYSN